MRKRCCGFGGEMEMKVIERQPVLIDFFGAFLGLLFTGLLLIVYLGKDKSRNGRKDQPKGYVPDYQASCKHQGIYDDRSSGHVNRTNIGGLPIVPDKT